MTGDGDFCVWWNAKWWRSFKTQEEAEAEVQQLKKTAPRHHDIGWEDQSPRAREARSRIYVASQQPGYPWNDE